MVLILGVDSRVPGADGVNEIRSTRILIVLRHSRGLCLAQEQESLAISIALMKE